MDERTEIAITNIAEYLKKIMQNKGLSAQNLIDNGLSKQQVYSVLRMGNTPRPNYSISTFINVCSEIHRLTPKTKAPITAAPPNTFKNLFSFFNCLFSDL